MVLMVIKFIVGLQYFFVGMMQANPMRAGARPKSAGKPGSRNTGRKSSAFVCTESYNKL